MKYFKQLQTDHQQNEAISPEENEAIQHFEEGFRILGNIIVSSILKAAYQAQNVYTEKAVTQEVKPYKTFAQTEKLTYSVPKLRIYWD